jgi:hypothetical protein
MSICLHHPKALPICILPVTDRSLTAFFSNRIYSLMLLTLSCVMVGPNCLGGGSNDLGSMAGVAKYKGPSGSIAQDTQTTEP